MAEQTCTVPEPDIKVIHSTDRMWKTTQYSVLSQNQTGANTKGHYLQIDGSSVKANATADDKKAKLRIHQMVDKSLNMVVMLESSQNPGWVVAVDDNDKVIAKQAPKKLMEYNTLTDVDPKMVFYKKPKAKGSDICYFESCYTEKEKKRILGFNAEGNPLDTTQVDSEEIHAHFRVLSVFT